MATLESVVRKNRQAMSTMNSQASRSILQRYTKAAKTLENRLDDITRMIDERIADGREVSQTWLLQQKRYQNLVADTKKQLNTFMSRVATDSEEYRKAAAQLGVNHGQGLIDASLGNRPPGAVSLGRLPKNALEELAAATVDEASPVVQSMRTSLGDEGANIVQQAIFDGVATGAKPSKIINAIKDQLRDDALAKANTIARTEMYRAYREANRKVFEANKDVIPKWIWHADLREKTCAACWAMHGQEFDVATPMGTHPNCRCTCVPKPLTWREMGYDIDEVVPPVANGETEFAKLDAYTQRQILGPGKFKAYKSGEIELKDLVSVRQSERFGTSRSVGSLESARLKARTRLGRDAKNIASLEHDLQDMGIDTFRYGFGEEHRHAPSEDEKLRGLTALNSGFDKIKQKTGLTPGLKVSKTTQLGDVTADWREEKLLDDVAIYSNKKDANLAANVGGGSLQLNMAHWEEANEITRMNAFNKSLSAPAKGNVPAGTPFFGGPTLEDSVIHEFGHSVDYAAQAHAYVDRLDFESSWRKMKRSDKYWVSEYAVENDVEGFAEAFHAYVTNSRKLPPDMEDAMKRIITKVRQGA